MSHAVAPKDLEAAVGPYGTTPFLLFVGSSGTARVNHVSATVSSVGDSATVTCTAFGRGIPAIVAAGGALSLLWSPPSPGEFSLIADGVGTMANDDTLVIAIDSAVLHRPAPPEGGAASC